MKGELSADAEALFRAICLAFRDRHAWGHEWSDDDFVSSMRELIEVGAIKIRHHPARDSGSGPSGRRREPAPGEAPQSGLSDSEGIAQSPIEEQQP